MYQFKVKILIVKHFQTVFSLVSVDQPLKDYPFPSVTICGQNKISEEKISLLLRNNPKYNQMFSAQQVALLANQILQARAMDGDYLMDHINNIPDTNGIAMAEVINITMKARNNLYRITNHLFT